MTNLRAEQDMECNTSWGTRLREWEGTETVGKTNHLLLGDRKQGRESVWWAAAGVLGMATGAQGVRRGAGGATSGVLGFGCRVLGGGGRSRHRRLLPVLQGTPALASAGLRPLGPTEVGRTCLLGWV